MDEDIYSENDTLYAIILNIDEPVIDLGPSISACDSVILDAGNPGFDYLWSTGKRLSKLLLQRLVIIVLQSNHRG